MLDDKTPTLELVREGQTLALRVHFVTRPGPLDAAAPDRVRPAGHADQAHARRLAAVDGAEARSPGAARCAGSARRSTGAAFPTTCIRTSTGSTSSTSCGEARETGEPDRAFIAEWMGMVDRELAAKGTERYNSSRPT